MNVEMLRFLSENSGAGVRMAWPSPPKATLFSSGQGSGATDYLVSKRSFFGGGQRSNFHIGERNT